MLRPTAWRSEMPVRAKGFDPESLPASPFTVDKLFEAAEPFIDRSGSNRYYNIGHGTILRPDGNIKIKVRNDHIYEPHDPEDIEFAALAITGLRTRFRRYQPQDAKHQGIYIVRSEVIVPQHSHRARLLNVYRQLRLMGDENIGSEVVVATEKDIKNVLKEIEAGKAVHPKLALQAR